MGICLLFFSCEIEQYNAQENLETLKSTSSTEVEISNECKVIDADRCPFEDQLIPANLWWPEIDNDWFNPNTYFSSTDDHQLTFTKYIDGTANIKGSTVRGTCIVEVDVWLVDKKSWAVWEAEGGSHKVEGCAGDATNPEDLSFYVIDAERSTLNAAGGDCLGEGSFGIEQRPDPDDLNTPNFGAQVGPGGANNDSRIGAVGLSTWAWITNKETGERLWIMDFNFLIDCPPVECAPCDGKVTDLSLKYNGNTPDAHIVVEQKKDGEIVFDEIVQPGDIFSFSGMDKKGTLGTEIKIFVNDVENTKIHTSCSKPIGPGLMSGDFEVVTGASRNGGNLCPIDTPPGGDCDECDGKATNLELKNNGDGANIVVKQKKDDVVVFNDFVAAGGTFSFSGQDKNGTLGTEIIIAVNGSEHTRIHTSCSKPLGIGTVSGNFEVVGGASLKGGPFCPIDTPPGGDCSECDGKVTSLTMQNNGGDANIIVRQKKDDLIAFDGFVASGGSFSFSGKDDKGTLGTEITIVVNGVEHTKIHTSCSKPIGPGLVSGDFEVLGGTSRNGGEMCPVDVPPTPPNGDDCGECDGKVTNLTLKNNGAGATIVVKQKKDDDIVFNDFVAAGETFSFSGTDKKGTLGTEIIIDVDGSENTRIHTSCSKPIGIGTVSGSFEVMDGASRNGGQFCSI